MPNFIIGGDWNYTGNFQLSNYTTGYAHFDSSGNITSVSVPSGGLTWSNVAGTSQLLATGNGYFPTNAGTTTFSLPVTANIGDSFSIAATGSCQFIISQNAGQFIQLGDTSSTTGVTGSLTSTDVNDGVSLVCQIANTKFYITNSVGNLNLS